MYTVQHVAKLSGVSVKTLYHYQKLGILMPNKIGENGYRYYSDKEINQLQEILFYKKLKFSLDEIRYLLQKDCSRLESLEKQKEILHKEQENLQKILLIIEKEIKSEKEGSIMDKKDIFEGFDEKDKNSGFYRNITNVSAIFTYGMHVSFIVLGVFLIIIGSFFPKQAAVFFGGPLYIIMFGITCIIGSVLTILLNKPNKTFKDINQNGLMTEKTLYEKLKSGKKKDKK